MLNSCISQLDFQVSYYRISKWFENHGFPCPTESIFSVVFVINCYVALSTVFNVRKCSVISKPSWLFRAWGTYTSLNKDQHSNCPDGCSVPWEEDLWGGFILPLISMLSFSVLTVLSFFSVLILTLVLHQQNKGKSFRCHKDWFLLLPCSLFSPQLICSIDPISRKVKLYYLAQ